MSKHSPTRHSESHWLWHRYWLHRHNWAYQNSQGFTLIELMVILVVIGILSAIALPSMINHALKARESEARIYVASVSKGQQVHYMEYGNFSSSVINLGVGIPTATKHYNYQTQESNDVGSGTLVALTEATQVNSQLRSFSGQVWIGVAGNAALTTSVFCEGDVGTAPPTIVNHQCQ